MRAWGLGIVPAGASLTGQVSTAAHGRPPTMVSSALPPPPTRRQHRTERTAPLCGTGSCRRGPLPANLPTGTNDGRPPHCQHLLSRSGPSRVCKGVCRAGAAGRAWPADAGATAPRCPRAARAAHGRAAGGPVHAAPAPLKRALRELRQRTGRDCVEQARVPAQPRWLAQLPGTTTGKEAAIEQGQARCGCCSDAGAGHRVGRRAGGHGCRRRGPRGGGGGLGHRPGTALSRGRMAAQRRRPSGMVHSGAFPFGKVRTWLPVFEAERRGACWINDLAAPRAGTPQGCPQRQGVTCKGGRDGRKVAVDAAAVAPRHALAAGTVRRSRYGWPIASYVERASHACPPPAAALA
jgi:hypothetical protein